MRIVAVTSCPTGIAHTYMAAEALEEEAKKRGHTLAVETQGSGGAEKVDASVIEEADAVVFAADAGVRDRDRFDGLPSVEVGVSEAINKPGAVLDRLEATAQDDGQDNGDGRAAAGGAAAADGDAGGDVGAGDGVGALSLVAVTSCPTGIAHTYMAAEALEEEAKKRGHTLAVETQGSSGSERVDDDTITAADAVIFAADADVKDRGRFEGLPFVEIGTGRAINKPAEVLDRMEREVAQHRDGDVASADGSRGGRRAGGTRRAGDGGRGGGRAAASSGGGSSQGLGTSVRQWLMTGVSYMLPFVVAGGILIALSFLLGDTVDVPDSNVYEDFTVPALLYEIGSTAFSMIGPILGGYIAYAMADRPGIAPGIVAGLLANEIGAGFLGALIGGLTAGALLIQLKKVPLPKSITKLAPILFWPLIGVLVVGALMILVIGEPIAAATDALTGWLEGLTGTNAVLLGVLLGSMMAFDMGGPVNKVAYTFAVGLLSAGVLEPMAAVMAAGMTPPLGLALATAVRKRLFTENERESGKAAWVMGASFITEGAIPFAAADPIRVIPALVVGSAVTGGLSMAFNAGLRAPHGGVFVVGLVDNLLLYALAILIGTVVTAAGILLTKSIGKGSDEEVAEDPEASEDTDTAAERTPAGASA